MSECLWPRGLCSPWNSPGQNTGVGSLSLLQGICPTHGSKPRSPALQADSLPAEPYGKPKNTGVGSLSLLQVIFPTQELNQGLLHCRRILYQLSYQGTLSIDRRWLCITVNTGTVLSNTCGQINRLNTFTCLILWVL